MPAAPRFVSAFRTEPRPEEAVVLPCEGAVLSGESRLNLMHLFAAACLALALSSGAVAAENPPAPSPWLRQLRFSPNGRYVLAQSDVEITVLTVQPLAVLFRMPAENATLAQFTPDSTQVVFVSSIPIVDSEQVMIPPDAAHVERWEIADRTRTAFVEVPLQACGTVALSPDSRVVACDRFEGTLQLIDVASGETIFEKKKFAKRVYLGSPNHPCIEIPPTEAVVIHTRPGLFRASCYSGDPGSTIVGFSPDTRYVIAEPESEGPGVAFDVTQRMEVPLNGKLSLLRKSSQRGYSFALPFAFVTPDLVLIDDPDAAPNRNIKKDPREPAKLASFPSGKVILALNLPPNLGLLPAADQNFIVVRVRPLDDPAAAYGIHFVKSHRSTAVQFRSGQEIIVGDQIALDVLGQFYVAEPNPGAVGLYERGKGLQATVVLNKK
jgi:hypothetical protein